MNRPQNSGAHSDSARKYSLNHDNVVTAYRRYGRLYNWIFGASMEPGRQKTLKAMNCQSGERILEVGVGSGLALPSYPEDVHVTAIDLSPDMLGMAKEVIEKKGLNHIELHRMDAQNMSFDENMFDKAAIMYVATVVPDAKAMMAEVRRVCKPDADIYVLNHFASRNVVIRAFEKKILLPLSKWVGFDAHFDMDRFIADSGMELRGIMPVIAFGYWKMVHLRNRPPAQAATGAGNP